MVSRKTGLPSLKRTRVSELARLRAVEVAPQPRPKLAHAHRRVTGRKLKAVLAEALVPRTARSRVVRIKHQTDAAKKPKRVLVAAREP